MPAGYTGVYGIKPTFGRVPAYPLSPFGTVAHIGPMTRTVADSALMLTVMNEPDARDWYAVPGDGADLRRACTASVKGWRIAYSPLPGNQIGRAAGRERVGPYGETPGGAVSL